MADKTTNRKDRLVARASTIKITPAPQGDLRRVMGPDTPMGQVAMKAAKNGLKTQINGIGGNEMQWVMRQHPLTGRLGGIINPLPPMTAVQRCELMGIGDDDAPASAETLWRLLGDTYNANRAAAGEIGAPKPTTQILQRAMTAAQKKDWDEALHPRDAHGKFSTDGSGWINIAGHSIHIDKQPHPILKAAVTHIANFLGLTDRAHASMEKAFDKGMITNDHQLYAIAKETQKAMNNGADQTHAVGQGLAAHGTFAVKPVGAIKSVPVWKQHHGHVNVATHDHPAVPEHVTTVAEMVAFPPKATAHLIDAVNSGKVKTDTHVAELMAHAQEIKKKTDASVGTGLQHLLAGATVHEAIAGLKKNAKAPIGSIGTPAAEPAPADTASENNFETMPDAVPEPAAPAPATMQHLADYINSNGISKPDYLFVNDWKDAIASGQITADNATQVLDATVAKVEKKQGKLLLSGALYEVLHPDEEMYPVVEPEPTAPEAPANVTIVTNEPEPTPEPPTPTALDKLEEFAKTNGWNIHNHAEAAAYAGISAPEANKLGMELVHSGKLVKTDHNVYAHKDTVAAVQNTPAPEAPDNFDTMPEPEPATPAGPHTVDLKDIKTNAWQPTLSAKAVKGDNPVWHTQTNANMLAAQATIKAFGTEPHPHAVAQYDIYKAAKAAGYAFMYYKISSLQAIYVMEKDGKVLTQAGAQALVNGVPETAPDATPDATPIASAELPTIWPNLYADTAKDKLNESGKKMYNSAQATWASMVSNGQITNDNAQAIIDFLSAKPSGEVLADSLIKAVHAINAAAPPAAEPTPNVTSASNWETMPVHEKHDMVTGYLEGIGPDGAGWDELKQAVGAGEQTDTGANSFAGVISSLADAGTIDINPDNNHWYLTDTGDAAAPVATPAPAPAKPMDALAASDQLKAMYGFDVGLASMSKNMWNKAVEAGTITPDNQHKIIETVAKHAQGDGYYSTAFTEHLEPAIMEHAANATPAPGTPVDDTFGDAPAEVEEKVLQWVAAHGKDAGTSAQMAYSLGIDKDTIIDALVELTEKGQLKFHGDHYTTTSLKDTLEQHLKDQGHGGGGMSFDMANTLNMPGQENAIHNELLKLQDEDKAKYDPDKASWVHTDHLTQNAYEQQALDYIHAQVAAGNTIGTDDVANGAGIPFKDADALMSKLNSEGKIHWDVDAETWMHNNHVGDEGPHGAFDKLHGNLSLPEKVEAHIKQAGPAGAGDVFDIAKALNVDNQAVSDVMGALMADGKVEFNDMAESWTHSDHAPKPTQTAKTITPKVAAPDAPTKDKVEAHVHSLGMAGATSADIAAALGIKDQAAYKNAKKLAAAGLLKNVPGVGWVHTEHHDAPGATEPTAEPGSAQAQSDKDKVEQWFAANPTLNPSVAQLHDDTGLSYGDIWTHIYTLQNEGKIIHDSHGYPHHVTQPPASVADKVANYVKQAGPAGVGSDAAAEMASELGIPETDVLDALIELYGNGTIKADSVGQTFHVDHAQVTPTGFDADLILKGKDVPGGLQMNAVIHWNHEVAQGNIDHTNAVAILDELAGDGEFHSIAAPDLLTAIENNPVTIVTSGTSGSPSTTPSPNNFGTMPDTSSYEADQYLAKHFGAETATSSEAYAHWKELVKDGTVTLANGPAVLQAAAQKAKQAGADSMGHYWVTTDQLSEAAAEVNGGNAPVLAANAPTSPANSQSTAEGALSLDVSPVAAENYAKDLGMESINDAAKGIWLDYVNDGTITPQNAAQVIAAAVNEAKSGNSSFKSNFLGPIDIHAGVKAIAASAAAPTLLDAEAAKQYVIVNKPDSNFGMGGVAKKTWESYVSTGMINGTNAQAVLDAAIADAVHNGQVSVVTGNIDDAVKAHGDTDANGGKLPVLTSAAAENYVAPHGILTDTPADELFDFAVGNGSITQDNAIAVLHAAIDIAQAQNTDTINESIMNAAITTHGTPDPGALNSNAAFDHNNITETNQYVKSQGMSGMLSTAENNWVSQVNDGTITAANAGAIIAQAIANAKAESDPFVTSSHLYKAVEAVTNGTAQTATPQPTTTPSNPNPIPQTEPISLSVAHVDGYLGQNYQGGAVSDMQTAGSLEIALPGMVADGTITKDNVKAILHEAHAIHMVDKPDSSYMEKKSVDKALDNLGIKAGGGTTAPATSAAPTAPAMPPAPFVMKTATLVMAGKVAKANGAPGGLSDQGKTKWKNNVASGNITLANAAQVLHAAIENAKAQGRNYVMAKDLTVGIEAWKAANGGATAQPAPTPAPAPKVGAKAPAAPTTGTPATPAAPVHASQTLLQPGTPPLVSKKIAPENFATMPDKDIGEKPFKPKPGKKASSGVIMVEPDGRIWIFEPFDHSGQKKGYNGYQNTFSKGGVDAGLTAQQNAHKELYEEMGMTAEIHGHIGDFDSGESTTRFYIGTRTGGSPVDAEHGKTQALKETDTVKLVTMAEAEQLLNKPRDKETLAALKAYITANGIPTPSPIAQPKHSVTIENGKHGPVTYDVDHMTPATDAQVDQLHAELKLSTNTQKALKAGIASGTYKTHGDLVEKVALASAAKKANGTSYDGIPSSGAFNDVTQYTGMQHLMDKADVGDAHAQKIAAAAGPHTFVSTKKAEREAAAAKVKELQENWEKGTPDQHMHRKIGGNEVGYNAGGMYEMPDGQLNYVKEQKSAAAAYNEVLAAEIYAALDKGAPQMKVIEKDGKVHTASKVINNQGHLGDFKDEKTGKFTPEMAHSILKGFAADALLANWDVLGNGKTPLSNVVIGEDGTPYRIDNGGAMLFGGAGGKKDPKELAHLNEWETLTNPGKNGNYANLFASAGIKTPEQIPGIGSQVQALKKLADAHGGWDGFIKQAVPGMPEAQRKQTADMLQKRLDQMFDKVKSVPMANSLVGSQPFVYDGHTDDVEKKINQIHKNNNPVKSSKIKDFVDSFKGSSMSFNGPLVGNGQMTGEKLQQFKDLNELLKGKSAEVGFDCVVGRNIGPGHNYGGANFTEIVKNMSKLVPGTIIPNLTYQSMSTQGCNVDVSGDQVQLCIYMPKETKVVPVGVYRGSETDWEHEVILPAGYSFRVIEVFEAGKVSKSDNVPAGFRWHGTSDKTPAGKVRMVVEVVCEGVNDAELPTPPIELLNKNNQTTVVEAQKAGKYIPPPDLSGLPPDALPWLDKPKK